MVEGLRSIGCVVLCCLSMIFVDTQALASTMLPLKLTIPSCNVAPVCDGLIGDNEYSFSGSGHISYPEGITELPEIQLYVSADTNYFYFGFTSPLSGELISKQRARDGQVWDDDSYEVFITTDNSEDNYHFIFNSKGSIYDELSSVKNPPSWNCKSIKLNQQVKANKWSAEIAISRLQLGDVGRSNRLRINLCRTYPERMYCSLSNTGAYNVRDKFAELVMRDKGPRISVDIEKSSLTEGKAGINIKINEKADAKYRVTGFLKKSEFKLFDKTVDLSPGSPEAKVSYNGEVSKDDELIVRISEGKQDLYYSIHPFSVQTEQFVLKYIYTKIEEKKLCVGIFQNYSLGKGLHGKLSLLRPDGTVVVQRPFKLKKKEIELTLNLESVKPGDYEVVAELLDKNSGALVVRKESFRSYFSPTPWEGNNIGKSDTVPVPWTPIIVDDNNTVNIWGRQYVLGKTGLPEKITSQGRSITGGHVKFVVRDQSGQWTPMSGEEINWLQKNDTVVEYTSVFSDGEVQIDLKGTIEYDGFFWFDIKCIPLNGSPFQKDVAFEIPINCEVVKLVNGGTAFLNNSGIIPESGWKKNLLGEWPVFWFGDESGGIQWFADDLRGWSLKDYRNSAEIIIRGAQPCVRIRLIDAASQEKRERNIGFGIMATPVKELPSKWRTDLRSNGKKLKLWWQGDYITKLYGYPEMVKGFREKYAAKMKQGTNWLPYLSFLTTNPYSPEYKYFGENWRRLPQERKKVNQEHSVAKKWGSYVYICPSSKSYRDFYMWKLKGFVEDADLHGLYFDFVQPQYRCSNTAHGCGWKDSNGDLRGTLRIRGMRKLAKRIYTMLKEHDQNAPIVYHDSGLLVAPIHGFAEMTWDGEHHVHYVAQHRHYYGLISLEQYRVNFVPRTWGIVTCVLPQFLRSIMLLKPEDIEKAGSLDQYRANHYKKNKKAIWHLAGLALLHDGAIDVGWAQSVAPAVYGIRKIQDDFGWGDDLEFLPYWDSNTPCRIENPISKDIVISAYRNSKGVMLVPFNNTDKPIKAVIIIEKGLEIPESAILTDAVTGQPIPCQNGLVKLNLDSRSYAILIWKN